MEWVAIFYSNIYVHTGDTGSYMCIQYIYIQEIHVWAPYSVFIILDHLILDHLIKAKKFPEDCMDIGEQYLPEHADYLIDKETFIFDHTQQEEL